MLDYFWKLYGKDKKGKYILWDADKEAQVASIFFSTIFIICYSTFSRILKDILFIFRIIISDIAIFIQNKQIDNEDS